MIEADVDDQLPVVTTKRKRKRTGTMVIDCSDSEEGGEEDGNESDDSETDRMEKRMAELEVSLDILPHHDG